MIKKIITIGVLCIMTLSHTVYANTNAVLTRGDLFSGYFHFLLPVDLPEIRRVDLQFTDVLKGSQLEFALQKAVYFDIIQNKPVAIRPQTIVKQKAFTQLVQTHFGITLPHRPSLLTKHGFVEQLLEMEQYSAVRLIRQLSSGFKPSGQSILIDTTENNYAITEAENFEILNNVYELSLDRHYDKDLFSGEDLIYGAASGIAEATGDDYTTFFEPVDAEKFETHLTGVYEGIGAYVDMKSEGELIIISPIVGSPAAKAGIRAGDRITWIDDIEVTEDMSLAEAVSLIKGPAGTVVRLTILRDEQRRVIDVTRGEITIDFIEEKFLDPSTYYVQVSTFGFGVSDSFSDSLEHVATTSSINRLIIDLRDNGGGSLHEVVKMLHYFVPKDEPSVVIRYADNEEDVLYSKGYESNLPSNLDIVILVNKGSASASEIMAGTMRDYLGENVKIIGTTTFGKGSVQNHITYKDTSSFKFTIAKWFTGKTQTGIDHVGIIPDIEIALDEELYLQSEYDSQLETARSIDF